MTCNEAAERLKVTQEEIDRLVADGRVEKRNRGNSNRIRMSDVEAVAIMQAFRSKEKP